MSEKQKRGCLAWLKYIVEDPQKLFGIIIVFMTMLSGAIVICVGLFAVGILFWMNDVGPYIKERLE